MSNHAQWRGNGPTKTKPQGSPFVSPFAERFAAAVQVLIADGPIKQRLAAAYSLHLADITEADLPPPLRRDFADLNAAICRVAPAGHETRVRASVQKMSPSEASEHAATIVKLYVALMNGLERAEPLKVVAPPRKAPRYQSGQQ
ncbi:MAG TPA: hypothetical protein VGL98_01655 [Gammaproteobacteria bacterium]|jgi:hypothetical protein